RHIAAFIAVHFTQNVENHLTAFASKDPEVSALGMLSLLAIMQWRLAPNSTLLALSSWLGGLMGPALVIYHSHTTRRQIEREIPKLVRKGSLPEIFNLLDNAQKREEDLTAFREAQKEYAETEGEIDRLKTAGADSEENVRIGNQTAAVISIILMMIVLTLLFLFSKW
ncbi:MAG: protein kinase family protein, partial [Rhodospirillales bacterium]|nr:protein kinase family protein [Rhodospirillales bacterium]